MTVINAKMFDKCFEWLSFARQLALYIDSGLEHGNFLTIIN